MMSFRCKNRYQQYQSNASCDTDGWNLLHPLGGWLVWVYKETKGDDFPPNIYGIIMVGDNLSPILQLFVMVFLNWTMNNIFRFGEIWGFRILQKKKPSTHLQRQMDPMMIGAKPTLPTNDPKRHTHGIPSLVRNPKIPPEMFWTEQGHFLVKKWYISWLKEMKKVGAGGWLI